MDMSEPVVCDSTGDSIEHVKCCKCDGTISGALLKALGKSWHVICFKCYVCDRQLKKFYTNYGHALCEEHYINTEKQHCMECEVEHSEEELIYLGSNGRTYCQEHYKAEFGFQCTNCSKSIEGDMKRIDYKQYHPDCFRCEECGEILRNENFHSIDRKVYCACDYVKLFRRKCHVCQEAVVGSAIVLNGTSYHSDCFRCSECNRVVNGNELIHLNDEESRIFCESCASEPDESLTKVLLVDLGLSDINSTEDDDEDINLLSLSHFLKFTNLQITTDGAVPITSTNSVQGRKSSISSNIQEIRRLSVEILADKDPDPRISSNIQEIRRLNVEILADKDPDPRKIQEFLEQLNLGLDNDNGFQQLFVNVKDAQRLLEFTSNTESLGDEKQLSRCNSLLTLSAFYNEDQLEIIKRPSRPSREMLRRRSSMCPSVVVSSKPLADEMDAIPQEAENTVVNKGLLKEDVSPRLRRQRSKSMSEFDQDITDSKMMRVENDSNIKVPIPSQPIIELFNGSLRKNKRSRLWHLLSRKRSESEETNENVQDVLEVQDGLQMEKKENNRIIIGGTIDKLIYMIGSGDSEYINTFALTFRHIISPTELMNKLMERFREEYISSPIEDMPAHYFVFFTDFLIRWIKFYYIDFNEFPELGVHLQTIMDAFSHRGWVVQRNRLEKMLEISKELYSTTNAVESIEASSIDFLSLKDTNIAHQLTMMEHDRFHRIGPEEFIVQLGWVKSSDERHKRHLNTHIQWFNYISGWVTTEILLYKSLPKRVAAIEKFIKIARELKHLHNYNSLYAVVSGLNHSSITRLKKTWSEVSRRLVTLKEDIENIMDPAYNFNNYRSALRHHGPPSIPVICIALKDLVFLNEAPKCFLNGYINFRKLRNIACRIDNIIVFQLSEFRLTVDPKTAEFFNHLKNLDEKALYARSCVLEPRKNGKANEIFLPRNAKEIVDPEALRGRIINGLEGSEP